MGLEGPPTQCLADLTLQVPLVSNVETITLPVDPASLSDEDAELVLVHRSETGNSTREIVKALAAYSRPFVLICPSPPCVPSPFELIQTVGLIAESEYASEIRDAIEAFASGVVFISPSLRYLLEQSEYSGPAPDFGTRKIPLQNILSQTQVEIARLLLANPCMAYEEIGRKLGVSERSMKRHVREIANKLQIQRCRAAVLKELAIRQL